jgi:hypothetical protein
MLQTSQLVHSVLLSAIGWQTQLIYALATASEIILIPAQSSIHWVGSTGKDFAAG